MGFYFVAGHCFVCRRIFTYNPNYVPSIRVNSKGEPDPNGKREPICSGCMEIGNKTREEMGLSPHPIHPQAYEIQDENEL